MPAPNIAQLKQALAIAEQIEKLQGQFAALFGGHSSSPSAPKTGAAVSPIKKRGKRKMSAEAREKIAAAQRARWAKAKGTSTPNAKAPATGQKKKRKLSPEGRARIVAALKARWAAKKKAGK